MPFTFAHPIVVLPFRKHLRKWIHFPSMVVGSIIPDAAYYLKFLPSSHAARSHSLEGSLYQALLTGLAVLFVLAISWRSMLFLLPEPHRGFLESESLRHPFPRTWRALLVVPISVLLGIWTHNIADAFTHEPGWFVQRFGFLRAQIFEEGPRVYKLLQDAGGVFGSLLIAFFYWKAIRQEPKRAVDLINQRWRWIIWGAIVLTVLVVTAWVQLPSLSPWSAPRGRVVAFRSVILSAQLFFALSISAALVVALWRKSGPTKMS